MFSMLLQMVSNVNLPFKIAEPRDNGDYEPQVIKIQSQNRTSINIRYSSGNGVPNVISYAGISRCKRLAVRRATIYATLPLITRFNNQFKYVVGSSYDITIPKGIYTSVLQVITAITTAVNATVPAPSALTATIVTGSTHTVDWSCGFPFAIVHPDNLGSSIFNSGVFGIGGDIGILGSANDRNRFYTTTSPWLAASRFDIVSTVLNMDSKLFNGNLQSYSMTVASVPNTVRDDTAVIYNPSEPLRWINIDERPVTNIDIAIYPDSQQDWRSPAATSITPQVTMASIVAEIEIILES